MQERGFSSHDSYSLSKLAMQLFTKELADRLGSSPVTANCLDPGTVNTKMLYAGWGACGIDLQASLLHDPAYYIILKKPASGHAFWRDGHKGEMASLLKKLC